MNYAFRKKPVVIEAFQMTQERRQNNSEWPNWLHEAWNKDIMDKGAVFPYDVLTGRSDGTDKLRVSTLENDARGSLVIEWNDFIIRGVQGELYPCKPDIFAVTYEAVE